MNYREKKKKENLFALGFFDLLLLRALKEVFSQ